MKAIGALAKIPLRNLVSHADQEFNAAALCNCAKVVGITCALGEDWTISSFAVVLK
jgi:hypothetical protein